MRARRNYSVGYKDIYTLLKIYLVQVTSKFFKIGAKEDLLKLGGGLIFGRGYKNWRARNRVELFLSMMKTRFVC